MAEFELPEFRKLTESFSERMEKHLKSIDDFGDAINAVTARGGTADEIVDDWEARVLLREMPEDSPIT